VEERDRRHDGLLRASVANKQKANLARFAELQGLVGKTARWSRSCGRRSRRRRAPTTPRSRVQGEPRELSRQALALMGHAQSRQASTRCSPERPGDGGFVDHRGAAARDARALQAHEAPTSSASSPRARHQEAHDRGCTTPSSRSFGFQKMVLPSLSLELNATKLKLLVPRRRVQPRPDQRGDNLQSFFREKFYASSSPSRGASSTSALPERALGAVVTLPLETQMKGPQAAAPGAPGQPLEDQREVHRASTSSWPS